MPIKSTISDLGLTAKVVFSKKQYTLIAIVIATVFWIFLNMFDQILFFSPVLAFHISNYAVVGFAISNITSILVGMVVSMTVYTLRHTKSKLGISFFSGTTLGMVSSACASCTSFGFFLISDFGIVGATASSFLTNYQIPIRLISIGLLVWAYYSAHRKLVSVCTTVKN